MALVVETQLAQRKSRSNHAELWKCVNPKCENLISNVDQKTIPKQYCSDECRQAVNRKKFKERHTKSGRYDKRKITPQSYFCNCGRRMLPLAAQTTIEGQQIRFQVPIKLCKVCKIVKFLEPLEVMK